MNLKLWMLLNGYVVALTWLTMCSPVISSLNPYFLGLIEDLLTIKFVQRISSNSRNSEAPPKPGVTLGQIGCLLQFSCVRTYAFENKYVFSDDSHGWLNFVFLFVVFDILYDLYYYLFHRLVHSHPILYKAIHKRHHAHSNSIHTWTAMYMTLQETLLTFPLFMFVFTRYFALLTRFEIMLIQNYVLLQEVQGHVGTLNYPVIGPTLYPGVANRLGVDLCAEDHAFHHTNPKFNFSKRMRLWDEYFGTFKDGVFK